MDGEQAAAAYKERRQLFYLAGKPASSPDSLKNHFYSWSNSKAFVAQVAATELKAMKINLHRLPGAIQVKVLESEIWSFGPRHQ